MSLDLRAEAARYYDLNPNMLADIPFYIDRLPKPDARVLELGCGTGRVSLPLAAECALLHGLDLSVAMLDLCREKIVQSGLDPDRIRVEHGDITDYDLGTPFDLIIAPYRVMQNLETDAQLDGLFRCIRKHLAPEGRCILNVFHPNRPREELLRTWATDEENLAWEVERDGERMTCHDVRRRMSVHEGIDVAAIADLGQGLDPRCHVRRADAGELFGLGLALPGIEEQQLLAADADGLRYGGFQPLDVVGGQGDS